VRQVRRVAMLSLHTSPLEQPGAGDAGGMNVYVRSLALELASMGIEVDIYTRASAPGQTETETMAPGVRVIHVPAGPPGKIPKEQLPALMSAFADALNRVRSVLAEEHYDVIHSHYWVSGAAGLLIAGEWKVPLVHTMHTMAKVKNLRLESGERPEPAQRIDGEQRIVDRATRLIANTRTEADELVELYGAQPEAIDVVAPGVDLDVFTPQSREESRASLGFAPDDFHVVFAGRLQRLKGPHILVEAAAELKTRRPDIPLRVSILGSPSGAGDFDLGRIVADLDLADAVSTYSPVAADELAGWFRAADVVAMPSFSESFGLVALEAQACGTPVVAANVGGLPDAVSDGRTGVLIDGHAPRRWSEALESLYDDAERRTGMGRSAALHARAFGWKRTAVLTTQSYRRAVAD
jgi:D-inositol-3-phosphate glycosyltransferase